MDRRYLFFGIVLAFIVALAAFAFWGGGDWNGHDRVTRVVPGQNGETLVIQEGGDRGFFPFFPFFLIFPLFWFLVIGALFSVFGRRRWGGGPPFGPGPQDRQAWLDDWHRQQHSGSVPPSSTGETEANDSNSA